MSNQSDKLQEAAEALKFAKEMIKKHFIIPGEELTDALEYIDSTLDALSKDTEQDREWLPLSDRSAPMPDDEELLVLFDTGEVILYSQDNWPEAMVTHWRLANLPKV